VQNLIFRRRELGGTRRLWPLAGLWVAMIIAAVGIIAVVLWLLPAWLTLHPRVTGAARHKAISDARLGIASILAVLGTAGGLAYTIRTYRLSRRGQIADRYTKAIEQLSDAGSDIRIGGIYALQQTTRDAAEYRHTVIDVLAAYIRNRAPWPAHAAQRRHFRRWHGPSSEMNPGSPEPDISAALNVLRELVRLVGKRGLDLSGTNLAGADLMEMRLLDAQFNGANLTRAKLNKADLRGADLRGAELKDAQLYRADFTDIRIWKGQLDPGSLKDVVGLDAIQSSDPPGTARRPPPARRVAMWRGGRRRDPD
jgi:Pentapeptide repeats (8 copies)